MTGFEGTTGRHSPEDPAVLAADTPAEERAATQSLGDIVGGAAYAGGLVVFFLSYALVWALGDLFGHIAWGALVVAIIWAIIGFVLYSMGRKALKQVEPMPETVDSVKHIPEALSTNEEHR